LILQTSRFRRIRLKRQHGGRLRLRRQAPAQLATPSGQAADALRDPSRPPGKQPPIPPIPALGANSQYCNRLLPLFRLYFPKMIRSR
jgi:hypothetical protein